MKKLRNFARTLGLVLAMAIGSNSIILCYDQAFIDHAFTRYRASFGVPAQAPAESKPLGFREQLKELFWRNTLIATERPAHETRDIVLKAVKPELSPANLIDKNVIDKMELALGEGSPLENLASRLTNHYALLATELGKKRLVEMLVQPTTDLTVIKQRQMLLKELVQNDALLAECKKALDSIKGKPESHLLSCMTNDLKNIKKEILDAIYPPFLKKRTTMDQVKLMVLYTGLGFTTAMSAAIAIGAPIVASQRDYGPVHDLATVYTVMSPLLLFSTAVMAAQMRFIKRTTNYVQDHLIGTATCVNCMQTLYQKLSGNPIFAANCTALKTLVTLNGYSSAHSDDFNTLIRRLETDTFKGNASFFSLTGRVLSTYQLLQDETVRNELNPALNALAELDVLVALACKIRMQTHEPVHYSFAQFTDRREPCIEAKNFWNPFVSTEKAVPNTFSFGPGMQAHQVILSGPNTGGKSTLLKALMTNEILAHTFGIAAADSFTTTPFAKLTCHMNITDDTAGGKSLFQAEIDRAKELVNTLRELPQDKFAFVIIDEIFTGTAPEQAEELSHRFIKQLSQFKNCIFISASHFKKLIGLEQETAGVCKNFHMGTVTDAQGNVTKYTYTITPGPSKVNNAYQLAKEHGIFF